ncbi:hypothetical protein M422DRAFT_151630 [Sphaerobolus stellatus SS14]|nr:hypothetical protein M422DRAFT_151630 [Sphaerobolus stellatus SS14]
MRGAFIVIEGLDRSGKTTQTALLEKQLSTGATRQVMFLKFPDRTTSIGKMIDNYLRSQSELDDRAIHLLFSANRWELASTIEGLLNSGTTIICDRYAFSGIAFTFAKSRLASATSAQKTLTYEWCRNPDAGLPAPDLTLFLDISPEAAKARGGYGDERYEKEVLQRRVREIFGRISTDVIESGGRWVNIDAGQEVENVAQAIWKEVERYTDGTEESIRPLWPTAQQSSVI